LREISIEGSGMDKDTVTHGPTFLNYNKHQRNMPN
jgi:hypothetical protein